MSDYQYPPPPPPPPPGGGFGGYQPPMPVRNNQKAVWSLVLGITGIFCTGVILGPIAIVLGVLARKEIERSGGMQSGTGMATAGIVLGTISVVTAIVVFVLVVPALLNSTTV